MALRLRHFFVVAAVGLCGWAGWAGYIFLFDVQAPHIVISGIADGQHCAGDVSCTIVSDKSGHVSVWLDGNPLINEFGVRAQRQDNVFVVPTKTIMNGKHALKVAFVDNTFNKNQAIVERNFCVDNTPLQAALLKNEADCKVFQGRTLHIQFQVNKPIEQAKLSVLSQTYDCFPEARNALVYEAFVPIECEEKPNEYLASIDVVDKTGNMVRLDSKFQVVSYPFKKQVLHVSEEKVAEEKALGKDMQLFEQEIEKITLNSIREKLWRGTFCPPIDIQRVTGEFGTVRTTQHKGRYAHKALDVINAPKSVVWAPQDGLVVLKDRFAHSGNTIVLDHGWGVISMFFHLDDFAKIEVGDKVTMGNPIGTLGKTGYAKGYHLHWEMRVNNVAIDPMQWTKPTF
jgi:murein DD-endopeptidase MepM/ murein hydrolase activator NlpD